MIDLSEANEKRIKKQQPEITTTPLLVNVNGRRFRNDEINIKVCNIYEMVQCDLNWSFPEIKDPWKRAKKHMILFNESFGEKSIDQIRFDHFLCYTHVCDVYKWMNRAYQFLKVGGVIVTTFIDFMYFFKKSLEADDEKICFNDHVDILQENEKRIFTTSDSSGLYYHRTILTPRRITEYLKRSFFTDIEIEKSYHEVMECDIYEVRAIKTTDKKLALAPDGTLIEARI